MSRNLVYWLYNLLWPFALLLGLPAFLYKGWRRGGLARNFQQRFGIFDEVLLRDFALSPPLWIHAVSVGEVLVALKLIASLRALQPARKIVLSTTTTTGYGIARRQGPAEVTVIHNPVDLPWVTARVIRLLQPSALVLVEAEVWPNLVRQLCRLDTPVLLVNARLSPRSERRYRALIPLIAPIFSQITAATVPFAPDRARWAALGIPEERISVLGSVKFDPVGAAKERDQSSRLMTWLLDSGLVPGARILLGASTHDGEEGLMAETWKALSGRFPDLALVIVPRHAERGEVIARQLRQAGYDPVLKSGSAASYAPVDNALRLWVANTTGELRDWFRLAEIVVIGKSFTSKGGQNPVEPIELGKAVIVGPHMQNFLEVVADLRLADGICQIAGAGELEAAVAGLLDDPTAARAMVDRAGAALERHEGASERTARFVLDFLR
jgi:3-deoxy-D-manno-octulosonic-acid transferase